MSTNDNQRHFGRVQAEEIDTNSLIVGPRGTDMNAPWTLVTPVFTNFTVGTGGVSRLRYAVIGKTVFWSLAVSQTAAGTCGGNILLNLPVRARFADDDFDKDTVGYGHLNATALFLCMSRLTSSTTMEFTTLTGGTTVGPNGMGNGFAAVNPALEAFWALTVSGSYEAE